MPDCARRLILNKTGKNVATSRSAVNDKAEKVYNIDTMNIGSSASTTMSISTARPMQRTAVTLSDELSASTTFCRSLKWPTEICGSNDNL